MTDTNIAAVILAAGQGSRMGSDLHKVLHEVAGKPMLSHVLDNLAALDAARSVVVVGAGREQILRAYPDITTAVQEQQLGTAHAVKMAQAALAGFEGTVLVLYGDVPLVQPETMRALCAKVRGNAALAVLGFRPEDTLSYGRLVTDAAGNLIRIVEHAEADEETRAVRFCNSGIMAVRHDVLFDLLAEVGNDNSKGEYYLTDIAALARQRGWDVATLEADPVEVTGVNSQAELAKINKRIAADGLPGARAHT
ncbi:NTP transferase domain-containing protein [Roseovarius sp. ZX-A-9]|uniref:NTP transferase domain-containing protein n=1 Tax=Roseovarius sp. ZX-A-9 TaxID=3014783 RepID=UPI0023306D53|nr:NTP transferase domain-containing protein [Roseovarius sp. ZX-A-9]